MSGESARNLITPHSGGDVTLLFAERVGVDRGDFKDGVAVLVINIALLARLSVVLSADFVGSYSECTSQG